MGSPKCCAPNPPRHLLWGVAYHGQLSQRMIEPKRNTKAGSFLQDIGLVGSRTLHQPGRNFPSTVSSQLSFLPLLLHRRPTLWSDWFLASYNPSSVPLAEVFPIISSLPNPILACASYRTRSNTLVPLRLHTENMQRGGFFISNNCEYFLAWGAGESSWPMSQRVLIGGGAEST